MKTTLNTKELKDLNACEEGYDIFYDAHGHETVTLSQALKSNGWYNICWFISEAYEKFSDKQKQDLRLFGCKKARENVEKIKPFCSNRNYKVITSYLDNPTESARSAAWSAARSAARSAAWSARSAAESARSAVRSAAWSAAMKQNEQDLMDLFKRWEKEDE